MGTELVAHVGTEALKTILFVAAPLLCIAIAVGLTVSILQAITQIQEMTLTILNILVFICHIPVTCGL